MFLGLEWYWWPILAVVLVLSIPLKVKFVKWWNRRLREKENGKKDKWGDGS